MTAQPSDSEVRKALQSYFQLLQSNPTVDQMRAVVTDDFETGFVDGYTWRGLSGLRGFLKARAGFVDEQHDVDAVLARMDLPSGEVEIKTRLQFSLRQPPGKELFTGTAFHTWRLRDDGGTLKVAAQMVDGFANLNDSAKRLFATPEQGLNRSQSLSADPCFSASSEPKLMASVHADRSVTSLPTGTGPAGRRTVAVDRRGR